jgi:hypothetical protein
MAYRAEFQKMGKTYGVTVLAPDRARGPIRTITDPVTGYPCKDDFPALNKKTGEKYRACDWTKRHIDMLHAALGLLAISVPGKARSITQDVAFVRLRNDNTGGYARYCAEAPPAKGGCLGADWSATSIKGVIVFHDIWDDKGDYEMQYTVIHELGHHVSQYCLAYCPDIVADMYRSYAHAGTPDKRADCREHYFTGVFARYVFEHAGPPLPDGVLSSVFGGASKDLDQIIDFRRGSRVKGKNLTWYMENVVIPAIPLVNAAEG